MYYFEKVNHELLIKALSLVLGIKDVLGIFPTKVSCRFFPQRCFGNFSHKGVLGIFPKKVFFGDVRDANVRVADHWK